MHEKCRSYHCYGLEAAVACVMLNFVDSTEPLLIRCRLLSCHWFVEAGSRPVYLARLELAGKQASLSSLL